MIVNIGKCTKMPVYKYMYAAAFCVGLLCSINVSEAVAKDNANGDVGGVFVPKSRSELVVVPRDIAEVVIADPDIADVHVIGSKRVIFIGKKIGRTNAKLFDKDNKIIRQFDVVVGYDLPAIRKALHTYLPHERIAVGLVNTSIAISGEVSDAATADKALSIVNKFINQPSDASGAGASSGGASAAPTGGGGASAASGGGATGAESVLNLLKISTGQQVMLRVRVGEIQRNAMKNLGVSLTTFGGNGKVNFATGDSIGSFDTGSTNFLTRTTPSSAGLLFGTATSNGLSLTGALEALETQGLLKLLAEPDLVAMSGEKAEFLAGGQFPITVPQIGGGTAVNTVQFQPYGVSVQFVPYVLSDDRIRIVVEPEVSEIDESGQIQTGTTPALITRRAKTTVELAPGESFMIAGLMSDRLNSNISQIPGASEIPILGALLRSTAYQRNETELVISVTPYLVDPLKNSDVRLPSDDFRPASTMEQFFYGSLVSMSGNEYHQAQSPTLEGPLGFITD